MIIFKNEAYLISVVEYISPNLFLYDFFKKSIWKFILS